MHRSSAPPTNNGRTCGQGRWLNIHHAKKKARYESGLEVHIKGGDMEETGVTILIYIIPVCFPLGMPDIQQRNIKA
jgi:hypothetical protein